jgi:hypothetical protein
MLKDYTQLKDTHSERMHTVKITLILMNELEPLKCRVPYNSLSAESMLV